MHPEYETGNRITILGKCQVVLVLALISRDYICNKTQRNKTGSNPTTYLGHNAKKGCFI